VKSQEPISDPATILDLLIEEFESDVKKYAARQNAKQFWLKKLGSRVTMLYELKDSIKALKHYETWMLIENEMERLEILDDQLSGHQVLIRTKITGNKISRIELM